MGRRSLPPWGLCQARRSARVPRRVCPPFVPFVISFHQHELRAHTTLTTFPSKGKCQSWAQDAQVLGTQTWLTSCSLLFSLPLLICATLEFPLELTPLQEPFSLPLLIMLGFPKRSENFYKYC